MNRTLFVGIMLFSMHILETTILQYMRIGGVIPNLMLVLVVSFALLRGSKEGMLIGATAGLLYEVSFGTFLGPTILTYAAIGYICGKLNKNFYRENFIIPFLCTLCSCFFASFVSSLMFAMRGKVSMMQYLGSLIIPEVIYTITLSLFIYQLIYILNEKLEETEKGKRNLF